MSRLEIVAAIAVLAACSTNCGSASDTLTSPAAPSAVASFAPDEATSAVDEAISGTLARGGGGKPTAGSGGTSGTGGTISIVLLDSTDGVAHFTQHATFAVSTSATAYPWVTVKCSQNGTLVYQESNGIFRTSLDQIFSLGPTPNWQSGGADCTATLENWDSYSKNGSITALKSMSFAVVP